MSKAPGKGQKTKALYALHWMPDLSPAARRVGAWFVWHANASSGRCDPGQARLQTETGLSRRTVQNAVNELVDCGVVSKKLRGTESSSYEIHWHALSDLVAQYEERANNGGKVVAPKSARDGGRKKLRHLAQKTAPKHVEINTGNELMFRVGTTSDKSEAGVAPLLHERTDHDKIGLRILNTRTDHGFVAYLDREVRKGRTFPADIASAMYERLEEICGGEPGVEGLGVTGQAYRLLTEFYLSDEENVACRT